MLKSTVMATPRPTTRFYTITSKLAISAAFLSLSTTAMCSQEVNLHFFQKNGKYYRKGINFNEELGAAEAGGTEGLFCWSVNETSSQLELKPLDPNVQILLEGISAKISGTAQSLTLENAVVSTDGKFTTQDFTTLGHSTVGNGHYTVNGTFSIDKNAIFEAAENLRFDFNNLTSQGTISTSEENLAIKLVQDFNLNNVKGINVATTLVGDSIWSNFRKTVFEVTHHNKVNGKAYQEWLKDFEDDVGGSDTETMSNDEDVHEAHPQPTAHLPFDQENFDTLQARYGKETELIKTMDKHALHSVLKILDKELKDEEVTEFDGRWSTFADVEGFINFISNSQPTNNVAAWLEMALEAPSIDEAKEILENADTLQDDKYNGIRVLVVQARKVLGDTLADDEQLLQILRKNPKDSTRTLAFLKKANGISVTSVEDFGGCVRFVAVFPNTVPHRIATTIGSYSGDKLKLMDVAAPFMKEIAMALSPHTLFLPSERVLAALGDMLKDETNYDFGDALNKVQTYANENEFQAQDILKIYRHVKDETARDAAISIVSSLKPQNHFFFVAAILECQVDLTLEAVQNIQFIAKTTGHSTLETMAKEEGFAASLPNLVTVVEKTDTEAQIISLFSMVKELPKDYHASVADEIRSGNYQVLVETLKQFSDNTELGLKVVSLYQEARDEAFLTTVQKTDAKALKRVIPTIREKATLELALKLEEKITDDELLKFAIRTLELLDQKRIQPTYTDAVAQLEADIITKSMIGFLATVTEMNDKIVSSLAAELKQGDEDNTLSAAIDFIDDKTTPGMAKVILSVCRDYSEANRAIVIRILGQIMGTKPEALEHLNTFKNEDVVVFKTIHQAMENISDSNVKTLGKLVQYSPQTLKQAHGAFEGVKKLTHAQFVLDAYMNFEANVAAVIVGIVKGHLTTEKHNPEGLVQIGLEVWGRMKQPTAAKIQASWGVLEQTAQNVVTDTLPQLSEARLKELPGISPKTKPKNMRDPTIYYIRVMDLARILPDGVNFESAVIATIAIELQANWKEMIKVFAKLKRTPQEWDQIFKDLDNKKTDKDLKKYVRRLK